MNRRKFAKAVLGTVSVSAVVPASIAMPSKTVIKYLDVGHVLTSDDGLTMSVVKHEFATKQKDDKQFSLTLKTDNMGGALTEKIYLLTDSRGVKHNIYMKPIDNNHLLAEFNWRTHD